MTTKAKAKRKSSLGEGIILRVWNNGDPEVIENGEVVDSGYDHYNVEAIIHRGKHRAANWDLREGDCAEFARVTGITLARGAEQLFRLQAVRKVAAKAKKS